jgi:hypothetical protein
MPSYKTHLKLTRYIVLAYHQRSFSQNFQGCLYSFFHMLLYRSDDGLQIDRNCHLGSFKCVVCDSIMNKHTYIIDSQIIFICSCHSSIQNAESGFLQHMGIKGYKQVYTGGQVKITLKLVKFYLNTLQRPLLTLQYYF